MLEWLFCPITHNKYQFSYCKDLLSRYLLVVNKYQNIFHSGKNAVKETEQHRARFIYI